MKDFPSRLGAAVCRKVLRPSTTLTGESVCVESGLTMCHKFSHIVRQNEANVT